MFSNVAWQHHSKGCHVYRQYKDWWWFILSLQPAERTVSDTWICTAWLNHSVSILHDFIGGGILNGFTSAVHRVCFYYAIRWSKQTFPEPVVCPACTNLMLEGVDETGWGGQKRKTVAFCHATFHHHLQLPMEDVLWIFYIVSSDTPHKIHLVLWQKCTPGTRRCPALAPQERLLSSTALTSHALLKSLVKDGHG